MAKKLDPTETATIHRGRPTQYPWDTWFSGDLWELTQHEDFEALPEVFGRMVRRRAEVTDTKVTVSYNNSLGIVRLQAEKPKKKRRKS